MVTFGCLGPKRQLVNLWKYKSRQKDRQTGRESGRKIDIGVLVEKVKMGWKRK